MTSATSTIATAEHGAVAVSSARRRSPIRVAGSIVGVALCFVLWFGSFGLPQPAQRSIAIAAFMVVFLGD